MTGAERKIGGKKAAFSAGISAEKTPGKKAAFSAGISAEKTPSKCGEARTLRRRASKRSLREGISAEKNADFKPFFANVDSQRF
ncbi:MAG: hypothetical protein LBU36_07180 [Clostridiales bacterium]|nr:hypothetical protein [Clostridiales bacterium]